MDAFLLKRAFVKTQAGFLTQFVTDGQEAVDYLTGIGGFSDRVMYPLPSLIMLDLKMPRLNGFDVLKWVKANDRLCVTPVLIFSGSEEARDVNQAYCLGASTYIVKPAVPDRLPEIVGAVEAYWSRISAMPTRCN